LPWKNVINLAIIYHFSTAGISLMMIMKTNKLNPVRVGVIGTGAMGQRHCRVYSGLRHVQLAGVCDISVKNGQQAAGQYQVPYYKSIGNLLEHVDAVSLAVPTPLHFDLTMRCLHAGIHVLVEKPITETVEQAEQLVKAAEASHLVLQVGHIERFNPAYIELRNVLAEMNVAAINLRRLSSFESSNTDVDVLLDLMIHDIDLVLDLINKEPVSIAAQGLAAFNGAIDHAIAQICFEQGPLVTITASRLTEEKVRSIEATALEAYVVSDLLSKNILIHRRTFGEYPLHNQLGGKYRQESIVERIHVPHYEPLRMELEHFIDCVSKGNPPQVSAGDGLNALRLAMIVKNNMKKQSMKKASPEVSTPDTPQPALVLN